MHESFSTNVIETSYFGKRKQKLKVTSTFDGTERNGTMNQIRENKVEHLKLRSNMPARVSSPKKEKGICKPFINEGKYIDESIIYDSKLEMHVSDDLFTRGVDYDLVGPLPIYNIWKRKFGADEDTVQRKWRQCCEGALRNYYNFREKLNYFESIVHSTLTLKNIKEKSIEMDVVSNGIVLFEAEISDVTKNLQNVVNYVPLGIHRNNLKQRIQSIRRRYFSLIHELNEKKEILRHVLPRLERRKYQEKEIKTWLDLAETRLCDIEDYYDTKLILEKHDIVEHIASEMESKFDIYAEYINTCKSILHVLKFHDLSMKLQDTIDRWDQLSSNIDDLLSRIKLYENMASFNDSICEKNQSDKESSELSCFSDFKIVNHNESWKIFTNKEVRLVRLHGNTIVVRVGGGWEYLYDFLLRVDPERAKYINAGDGQSIDAIGLRGLYLSPKEKRQIQEFTMSVERKKWKSWSSVPDIPEKVNHSSDEDSGILCESK